LYIIDDGQIYKVDSMSLGTYGKTHAFDKLEAPASRLNVIS
jgi:hypothetical protein